MPSFLVGPEFWGGFPYWYDSGLIFRVTLLHFDHQQVAVAWTNFEPHRSLRSTALLKSILLKYLYEFIIFFIFISIVYFFQNMHHAYKSCSSHMEQESEKVYIVKYIIFKYFHIVSKYQLFSLRDCVTIF